MAASFKSRRHKRTHLKQRKIATFYESFPHDLAAIPLATIETRPPGVNGQVGCLQLLLQMIRLLKCWVNLWQGLKALSP
jgi:hypothetical protein